MAGMTRSVAVLRGINVGGNRKVRMVDLKAAFDAAGCTDVETYIQSGNVVFTHAKKDAALETVLEAQLLESTGFEIAVLTRTAREMRDIVEHNPYPGTEGTKLVVWFLRDAVAATVLDKVDRDAIGVEDFTLRGREIYLFLPNGQGRGILPVALGKCKLPAGNTARNWNTVVKLTDMASV